MATPTPHDALFKQVFSQPDHAAGVLRTLLPEPLVRRADWPSLRLCPGSFVDDALRAHHSDLLFAIDVADRPALLYVLFEHKSTDDHRTVFQVLVYVVQVWQRHLERHPETRFLPPVIPIVVHHSDRGWNGPTQLQDLIDLTDELRAALAPFLPSLQFILDDLSALDEAALRSRAVTSLAKLTLLCLARARHSDDLLGELRRFADAFRQVYAARSGGDALAGVMSYYHGGDRRAGL